MFPHDDTWMLALRITALLGDPRHLCRDRLYSCSICSIGCQL